MFLPKRHQYDIWGGEGFTDMTAFFLETYALEIKTLSILEEYNIYTS